MRVRLECDKTYDPFPRCHCGPPHPTYLGVEGHSSRVDDTPPLDASGIAVRRVPRAKPPIHQTSCNLVYTTIPPPGVLA